MQIHVVIGTCGEYSDRTEWLVRAYQSEDDAKAIVEKYNAQAKEIEARCKLDESDPNYFDRYNQWDDGFKWPHDDPDFQTSYTGTDYTYSTIECC